MEHTAPLAELLARHGFRRHKMSRSQVGHLHLDGQLGGEPVNILLDTGAASTIIDLSYCHSRQIPLRETGMLGGGAGGVNLPIYALGEMALTLDGSPLRSDGIYTIDMSHVNKGLATRGAAPVQAVLGADILLYHQAVIDYATLSLFLKQTEG